jgi:outer membrane protein assembly factor BamB
MVQRDAMNPLLREMRRHHRRRFRCGAWVLLFVVLASHSEPIVAATDDFATRWIWSDFSSLGGPEELLVEDLDQDGRAEVLATASATWSGPFGTESWWQIGEFGDGYRQVWSSLPQPGFLDGATLAHEDGRLRVVFENDGQFLVIDVATRELVRTSSAPSSQVRDHVVADLDGDGELELIGCSGSGVFVLSFQTGALLRDSPAPSCWLLDVGQFDSDPALELLLSRPGVTVLDGSTLAVEWSEIESGADWAQFADLDDDPLEEILIGTSLGLSAIDVATATTIWERPDLESTAGTTGEVDPSSAGEELVILSFEESPLVLSARTGVSLWAVETWNRPASSVRIGDVLGAGSNQLVFSVAGSLQAEAIVVVDSSTREVVRVAHKTGFPTPSFQVFDDLGDGTSRIWAGTSAGPIPAVAFELSNRETSYDIDPPIEPFERGRSTISQLDLDPPREICWITCDGCGTPAVRCADLATHATQWTVQLPDETAVTALAAHDLDGDGTNEVLVGAASLGLFAFEGSNGWLRWRTPATVFGTSDFGTIRVDDLDSDGALEIVAGSRSSRGNGQGRVWVFDAATGAVENGPSIASASALDLGDLNGSGGPEIVMGDILGDVRILDPATGSSSAPIATASGVIEAVRTSDFDRDGATEIAVVASSRVEVYEQLAPGPSWIGPPLGQFAGRDDSMFVLDANHNGIDEILVSTVVGFALFEGPEYLLLAAGFETGDTSEWSVSQP